MRRLDLSGVWQLSQLGSHESIPAQVPGDNHSALLQAGKIPDPYWGDNELAVQWVGEADWVYSRKFRMDQDMLQESSVFLHCEGLDTITDIYINDQHVASTDNMFRRYRFEIKEYCRLGENEIKIVFHSPVKTAAALSKEQPYEVPHRQYPIQSPQVN